jgi:hypothetical protein
MKNVTDQFNRYRECARHLWNSYFVEKTSSAPKWELRDAYDDICTRLFSSLVLVPLGKSGSSKSRSYDASPEPLLFIRVIPVADMRIHVNRDATPGPYWDYLDDLVNGNDLDMRFIDCFDFEVLEFRDFRYYRTRIVASKTRMDIVGRDALVASNNVQIIFNDEPIQNVKKKKGSGEKKRGR